MIVAIAANAAIPPPVALAVAKPPVSVPGKQAAITLPGQGESEIMTASGQVLAGHAQNTAVPLASVTKVMTALVVLDDHPLSLGEPGPTITVSAAQAATLPARIALDQSLVTVTAGEKISELTALQALLIPSADNMADILASFDAGSLNAFVAKMNSTAKALGMTHTSYVDASGYEAGSESTASDQLLLARKAMANPVFAQIVDMPSANLPLAGNVTNYNTLAGKDGYIGIKTGSTGAAGGCLVWAVTRKVDGIPITLFGIVLGQRNGPLVAAAINAAQALTDSAFSAFAPRTVLPAGTPVYKVTWADQTASSVTAKALETIYPPGTPAQVSLPASSPPPFSPAAGPAGSVALRAPTSLTGDGTTSLVLDGHFRQPTLLWRVEHFLGVGR